MKSSIVLTQHFTASKLVVEDGKSLLVFPQNEHVKLCITHTHTHTYTERERERGRGGRERGGGGGRESSIREAQRG